MARDSFTIGILGGNGMLGGAMARGLLASGIVAPDDLWICSRRGSRGGLPLDVNATRDLSVLAGACDVILLSVPPAEADALRLDAPDRLVISVMAGVTLDRLEAIAGGPRVVRAMCSPAAVKRLAYAPWVAGSGVALRDKTTITRIFEALGKTDELKDEAQLDLFTALTGPVPGFAAYFAEVMVGYAEARGIDPRIADRAVRQLFRAAGEMMAEGDKTPSDHVQQMIDYDGTTAAGLRVLRASPIPDQMAEALDAAVEKSRSL